MSNILRAIRSIPRPAPRASRPVPNASRPAPKASRPAHPPLPSPLHRLPTAFRLLPTAHCLLPTAPRLLPTAFRLPTAFCLLLTASPLVSPAAATHNSYAPVPGWPKGAAEAPGYGVSAVSAVAIDARGQVFVFQRAPHPVLVFDREGNYRRSWGAGMFTSPHGCRFDPEGNLWLTDSADHRVVKCSPDGKVLATFGVRNQPGADATHYNRPTDVAFGAGGEVYISDGYGNARVVLLSREGKYLSTWGRKGKGEGEFNLPHSIAVDKQGRVFVADRENQRIQIFTPEGRFLTQWNHVGYPYGLFITPDQRLFVTDGRAHTVSLYDLDGKRLAHWGALGKAPGEFDLPHLLCVDESGALYVAEVNGKRLQKFTARPRK